MFISKEYLSDMSIKLHCSTNYFVSYLLDMDQVMQLVDPAKQFAKDSLRLVKRCTKPDRKGKK